MALVSGKEAGKETRAAEADKARWLGDVTECLRTYDVLGLWSDAEEVIRTDVVREFVKNVRICPALVASCLSTCLIGYIPRRAGSASQSNRTRHTFWTRT